MGAPELGIRYNGCMTIRELELTNFRSYDTARFELHPDVTLVVGPNASGKTNLLESLYVLAVTKSFRAKDRDLVRHEHDHFRIVGRSEASEYAMGLSVAGGSLESRGQAGRSPADGEPSAGDGGSATPARRTRASLRDGASHHRHDRSANRSRRRRSRPPPAGRPVTRRQVLGSGLGLTVSGSGLGLPLCGGGWWTDCYAICASPWAVTTA